MYPTHKYIGYLNIHAKTFFFVNILPKSCLFWMLISWTNKPNIYPTEDTQKSDPFIQRIINSCQEQLLFHWTEPTPYQSWEGYF